MSIGKRLFLGDVAAADSFCMNTSDNPLQEATSSLVAGYSLDYDASDITGDYDGTPSNVTFGVDGQINWGAEFNGTSSKISIGNPIGVSDNFTISAWFNASSGGFIYGRGVVASSGEHGVGIVYNSTNGNFYLTRNVGTSTLYYVQSANNIVPAGQWNFIAATFDKSLGGSNGVATIYANGSQVGQQTNWNTNNISYNGGFDSGVQVLGERGAGGFSSSYITGTLDQVRVFNRALDSDEVETLYNESACTHIATTDTVGFPSTASSNLVAYYKLDGSAEDESSNSYDGTPSNITYEFGRYGTAARFNGTNGSLDIESSDLIQNNTESFSFWFKDEFVFGFYDPSVASSSDRRRWFIDNGTAGSIKIQVNNDQYNYEETGITTLDGNWHHLVATSGGKLYIDGNPLTDFSTSYWVTDGTNGNFRDTIRIGTSDFIGSANQSYSEGSMDQIRIYDKALTSDEVTELYNEKQAYITKDAKNPFSDDDEVAFYKFENNADDEHDSYDGTASNVTFTSGSGLFGTYAASFNGSSSHIDIPSPIPYTNTSCSFSCWFNLSTAFSSGFKTIIGAGNKSTEEGIIRVLLRYDSANNYKIEPLRAFVENSYYTASSSYTAQTINAGTWYHLVFTYSSSGNTAKIYLNGSLVSTTNLTTTSTDLNNTGVLALGQYRDSASAFNWNGKIDQVRFFDRALDGDEVFKLYAEVIN